MSADKKVIVTCWEEMVPYLTTSDPIQFFISSSTLSVLGAGIVKAYQDQLAFYPHTSLTVECATPGQGLRCLYQGVKRILYATAHQPETSLCSIATKLNARIN
ncbi:MAG: hypothetical protein A2977_03135 [Alphaproteobacteria bacterium RIFCSPLOWO2_01_FULL_45_8]|nr:MAG: hypothetical protein A2065_00260 [Alphaproteobacteria bacterium GWB1_45_5]OFW76221.1 MAG: hypothetical protein A3K20_01670 [Alphaproteobacteria bacterium GWA1_45_9]OFW89510.1 MAG: hypothetical protein A2621_01115 [Alphaproteobacteria bacterium RIFCSPHIGHO2_01_FULL_41_14]OFW95852.1 MAG: hypothetical protein A2977_03135 [Alphaproteobacteria bacterium RIFCSPLOWO2_01_FULL_45_8]HCI48243.1 hypothetical protein [Holosporales bacterium]